jgi:outer membrane immunogenic protein
MRHRVHLGAAALLSLTAASAYADPAAFDWSGYYAGASVGSTRAVADGVAQAIDPNSPIGGGRGSSSGSENWTSTIVGLQLGYNCLATNSVLLGLEADLSPTDLKHDYQGVSRFGISDKTFDMDGVAMLRGRIGYVAADNWLVFGTAGAAWTRVRTTNTQGPCGSAGAPGYSVANCSAPAPAYNQVPYGAEDSNSTNRTGWTLGIGAEVGFASNWTARIEYVHTDFGSFTLAYPSFNRQTDYTLKTDTLALGVNYKF